MEVERNQGVDLCNTIRYDMNLLHPENKHYSPRIGVTITIVRILFLISQPTLYHFLSHIRTSNTYYGLRMMCVKSHTSNEDRELYVLPPCLDKHL